jgi:hypothetical protein
MALLQVRVRIVAPVAVVWTRRAILRKCVYLPALHMLALALHSPCTATDGCICSIDSHLTSTHATWFDYPRCTLQNDDSSEAFSEARVILTPASEV